MALRYVDSFDHYGTADFSTKYTSGSAHIDNAHARTGIACAAIQASGLARTVDNQSTWIVGAALQWNQFGGGFAVENVVNGQVFIGVQGDGTFFAARGT